jgi:site-specific DNA-cytosine methylase
MMKLEYQAVITEQLGVKPIQINSALVSAQNRNRLYWTNIPVFEQPENKNIVLKDIIEGGTVDRDKAFCLDASYYKGGSLKMYFEKHRRQLVFNDVPIHVGQADLNGHDIIKRVYSIEGKSPTLTAVCGGNQEAKIATSETTWRKLTPKECERLQTLPDGYTEGVSNSQRYKMLGNGWTVAVIEHLFKNLLDKEKGNNVC